LYREERDLFGFFVSGLSVLDSFSFLMYFAGAQLRPTVFRTERPGQLGSITIASTAEAYGKAFPNDPFTSSLIGLKDDPKLKEWRNVRNVLAHRAAPGRVIYASTMGSPPPPSAEWKIEPSGKLRFDQSLTTVRLEWLVKTLAHLIDRAAQFADTHF
jgi:hypothetical protein